MDISLLIGLQLFRTPTFRETVGCFVEGEAFLGVVNRGATDAKFRGDFGG